MLNIISQIMDECIPQDRAPRDFCVKFPEEIRHDNLAGQLWFGAEVASGRLGSRVLMLNGLVQTFLCEPAVCGHRSAGAWCLLRGFRPLELIDGTV